MPYSSNADLPSAVKNNLPSAAQTVYRRVANNELKRGADDSRAAAVAWTAVKNGWRKTESGEWVKKSDDIEKAEYQGKEVEIDKPFRTPGESKKFAVYVKDGDAVKIVRFGDPDMEIRRDDKEARANFRARHQCDTATDKTSARYWSCRMWDKEPVSDIAKTTEILKVDDELGLVFGYAMVCKIDGEPHFDLQGHHIPEDTMTRVLAKFMQGDVVAKDMHTGEQIGTYVFAFPMTTEIAKSLDIQVKQTGALVAMKPDSADMIAKFKSGERTGFSIGGINPVFEDVEE